MRKMEPRSASIQAREVKLVGSRASKRVSRALLLFGGLLIRALLQFAGLFIRALLLLAGRSSRALLPFAGLFCDTWSRRCRASRAGTAPWLTYSGIKYAVRWFRLGAEISHLVAKVSRFRLGAEISHLVAKVSRPLCFDVMGHSATPMKKLPPRSSRIKMSQRATGVSDVCPHTVVVGCWK